jgi:hypothetical protein
MADPVSILALMGLVYTGKKLADQPVNNQPVVTGTPVSKAPVNPSIDYSRPENEANLNTDFKINSEERDLSSGEQMPVFADVAKQERSSGGEVLDMKDRFVTDLQVHNNLSPIPQQKVGPGLGVNSDVPAVGGFQQMFRAMPENVGAYRLTTLPGRIAPGGDTTGGRGQNRPELGYNRPERTSFLPERRPPVFSRGQGQGGSLNGVVVREEYEKTKRSTNRSQTGLRTDGLEFASAKRLVSHGTIAQDPTRNQMLQMVNTNTWTIFNQVSQASTVLMKTLHLLRLRATKSGHQQNLLNMVFASVNAGRMPNTVTPTLVV